MENIVEIKNLRKTYITKNGSLTALDNINLDIGKGEIFGIIGLSGAGKSTLVRCINYLEKPTEGDVVFNGMTLGKLSPKDLRNARQSIGMIFQNFNLLEQRTALKNICFPLEISGMAKQDAVARARELLKLVGLEDKEKSYPSQLSGGQKQRVAIARALATKPEVLLCDEATSALDPNTTSSILELLQSINETMGVTIIVITHEMSVIEKICNRVAVIDKSHIVEMGDVKEVFLNPSSDIAKQLILPKGEAVSRLDGKRMIRIVFDGKSSFEPIISNMTLECRTPVNILFADTKDIDGKAFGQMVLQLPDDINSQKRILSYLDKIKINYKEEKFDV